MSEKSDKVYIELQESLDKLPVSYPATESGVEIRILKRLFSPEKALVASKLTEIPRPIEDFYKELEKEGIPLDRAEKTLDEMHEEGLIIRIIPKDVKLYVLSPFVLGFYEYQMNKMTEGFIHDVDEYFQEYLRANNKVNLPQLRTIPIEQSVGIENNIATYDEVRALIDNSGEPIVVNECICRKKNGIIGKPCKKTDLKWACLSFRSHGMAFIDKGLGKIITKEEAYEIIEKAQQDGLVVQCGNSQRPPSLCFCCGCCCNLIYNQKKFEAPAQYFDTNYYAQVDSESCSGCGTCETRCQMDAIEMVDDKPIIDLGSCIGCGLCTPTCPDEAITLIKKEKVKIPPKDTKEMYMTLAKNKQQLDM